MHKLDSYHTIIDAACEPNLFSMLAELNPPSCCLYSNPISDEVLQLAHYLVEVTDEVKTWLAKLTTPWGIYLYTKVSMRDLRQHLRKYLMVSIPIKKYLFFGDFIIRVIFGKCSLSLIIGNYIRF